MSFARSIFEALGRYWTKTQADARYYLRADVDGLLAAKAPLASPALTGTPTAPTAAAGTSTTQLATTAFVAAAVLPKADSTAVGVALAQKVNVSDVGSLAAQDADSVNVSGGNISGTNITDCAITNSTAALVGTPTAPTAASGTNTTQIATTAFCRNEIAALVNAAPATLDTLGEIAAQLASDESAAAALTTTVAGKLAKTANLSDLTNAATARTNLGLGALATLGTSPTLNNLTLNFAATVGTTLTVLDPTLGLGGVAIHDSTLVLAGGVVGLNPADPSEFGLGLKVGGAGVGGDTPGMVFDTQGDTAVADYRTVQFRNLGVNVLGLGCVGGAVQLYGNGDVHLYPNDTGTDAAGKFYSHAAENVFGGPITSALTVGKRVGGQATSPPLSVLGTNGSTQNLFEVWTGGGGLAFSINQFGTPNLQGFNVTTSSTISCGFSNLGQGPLGLLGTQVSTAPGAGPYKTFSITPVYRVSNLLGTTTIADVWISREELTSTGAATTFGVGNQYLIYAEAKRSGVTSKKFSVDTDGNLRLAGNLGVGNSAAATTLGTVVKKVQIFDAAGTSLGYIPVYDAIT